MINYNKLMDKLKEKEISTYTIRQKQLIPQSTMTKFKMCSVTDAERKNYPNKTDEEIIYIKLQEYKQKHNGKDFMCDVSTKTIEDICQLLQCQPQDLIDWNITLRAEESYENKYGKE